MSDRRSPSFPPVGGSSLLVIFAVLCLTVFALLALTTARSNSRLSAHSAEAVTACYEAEAEAEELVARLRAGELPEGVSREGDLLSFSVTVSPTQALEVVLRQEGDRFTLVRRQLVSTTDWQPDNSLPVWNGEG